MSSHFLTDKSLTLEARFGGYGDSGRRSFAEPGVEPRFAPDLGFSLRHIDVSLDIDPSRPTVRATTALRVEPLPTGLGEVAFDLDHVGVEAVFDGDGQALDWRHANGRLVVRGLPQTGGTVVVHSVGAPRRGMYFVGPTAAEPHRLQQVWTQCQDQDAHYFFPCLDHPSVKAPMTLRVRAPAGHTVVSNGRLARHEGDTWVWEQPEPIPAYLATIVVAQLDFVEESWRGRPVRYLAPQGTDPATLRRVFGRTPAMIEFFSQRFGVDYPWPRYDQVVVYDFIFGGMENVAATTLTDLVLTDQRAALDYDSDDLIAHELAHQWFGDLVTCQDWSQAWLNEGWATYAQHLWNTHARGQDEADWLLFQQLGEYLDEDAGRYRRAIVDYRFREPIDLFDRHLYEKGALVLHTLRSVMGDDAFFAGTRAYLEQNAHSTVHTRDFQRALERASGRNLDGFFQQWVLGAGHPCLEVALDHSDGLLSITVRQTQSGESVAEAFQFPLRIALVRGDHVEELRLPVRERERTWSVVCAEAPDRVEVDAGFGVLADMTLKASRRLLVASLVGDRVVGRVRAARALAAEASPGAIDALAAALREDPFWGVRAEAARALGRVGGQRARDALLEALRDPHPKARRAIVAALGELRHPDVEAALVRLAVDGDPSIHVEGEAARALGRSRSSRALEVAEALLGRESWASVLRARALEGLAASRDPAALPVLLAWSGEDRPARARAAAAAGLGRLADEVEPTRREAADRLIELAREAPFRVRLAAIQALGVARDGRSLGALRAIHEAEGDGRLRRAAYESMQKVAAGRSGEDALAGLRRDLEGLREENRALRDRLARLEDRSARQGASR